MYIRQLYKLGKLWMLIYYLYT